MTDEIEALLPPLPTHSPHCCMSRGCHDVCSHLCHTDLEALPDCNAHDYCRRQRPIRQLRIERAERERTGQG